MIFSIQCNGKLWSPNVFLQKLKIILKIYVAKDTKLNVRKRTHKEVILIEKIVVLNKINHEISDFKTVIAINQANLTQLVFNYWKNPENVSKHQTDKFINIDISTELIDDSGAEYFVNTEYNVEKQEEKGQKDSLKSQNSDLATENWSIQHSSESKKRQKIEFTKNMKLTLLDHAEKFNECNDVLINSHYSEKMNCNASVLTQDDFFDNVHSEFDKYCRIRVLF